MSPTSTMPIVVDHWWVKPFVYVLSSLISNNGIADVGGKWESGFNAAKNDSSSGSALEIYLYENVLFILHYKYLNNLDDMNRL
jgi:hypothetical protein